jgi:hypothetical protein
MLSFPAQQAAVFLKTVGMLIFPVINLGNREIRWLAGHNIRCSQTPTI